MSRKNHDMINGKLLRTDKNFSHLKRSQAIKINEWIRLAYNAFRDQHNRPSRKKEIDWIADIVYEKIQEAEIWIPYGEVSKHLSARIVRLGNKYEKQKGMRFND